MSSTTGNTKVLYGLYNDEEELLHAVEVANSKHLEIMDVFTPFPVHGLDDVMHLEQSRLHQAGFVYGALGTLTAFLGMSWIFTRDWRLFLVVSLIGQCLRLFQLLFELTVLFASIGMVVTFYTICGLAPGFVNPILDPRTSDDKFSIAFNISHSADGEVNAMESFFKETGASETNVKEI